MAEINGTNGDDDLKGNPNQGDYIFGGRGNDRLQGLSGNDYLGGGRGNDVLIGGSGSDVISGGLDSDSFEFSAGHVQQSAIDWIVDFSFNQNDSLRFRPSAGNENIEILSAEAFFVEDTAFNGYDLSNSSRGREVVLEIRNTVSGNVQKIVLIDSYSSANADQWDAYLATLGFNGGVDASLERKSVVGDSVDI